MDYARLLSDVARGERLAIREFVDEFGPLVQRLTVRMLRDPQDREEAWQDAMLQAIRAAADIRDSGAARTWIARIAHRICLMRLRRRQLPLLDGDVAAERGALERVADPLPSPEQRADRKRRAELVRDAIELLPPLYRAAVTLHYLEQMSVAEIAAVMETPEGTVKSYLHRARQRLRTLLEDRIEDE